MVIYLVRHGKDYEDYRGGWSNLGLIQRWYKSIKEISGTFI